MQIKSAFGFTASTSSYCLFNESKSYFPNHRQTGGYLE